MSSYLSSVKWPTLSMPSILTRSAEESLEDAPLNALPEPERKALNLVREKYGVVFEQKKELLPQKDRWRRLDGVQRDEMLLRFLRYNALHVENTVKQLEETLQWRGAKKIAEQSDDVLYGMDAGIPVAQLGKVKENGDGLFFSLAEGYDKKGVNHKIQQVAAARMFERIVYAEGVCVKRGTVVIDFSEFSVKNVDLYGLKNGVSTYVKHYPDVFHKILLINYPRFMYGVWKIIGPLLDSRTRSRVIWVADGEGLRKELEVCFDRKEIPVWMGGDMVQDVVKLYNGVQVETSKIRERF